MKRPWVKVCGITNLDDARVAVSAGADALGFILAPESPRYVPPESAARICSEIGSEVIRIGVVVASPVAMVRSWIKTVGLDGVQAHGDESPEACREYGRPVIKAFPVDPEFSIERLEPYREFGILLDGYAPGARGGTGRLADWGHARTARDAGYTIVLAGGLGPETVLPAIEAVKPVGVDLNSGVERSPGVKDHDLIRRVFAQLNNLEPAEEHPWRR